MPRLYVREIHLLVCGHWLEEQTIETLLRQICWQMPLLHSLLSLLAQVSELVWVPSCPLTSSYDTYWGHRGQAVAMPSCSLVRAGEHSCLVLSYSLDKVWKHRHKQPSAASCWSWQGHTVVTFFHSQPKVSMWTQARHFPTAMLKSEVCQCISCSLLKAAEYTCSLHSPAALLKSPYVDNPIWVHSLITWSLWLRWLMFQSSMVL